MREDLTFAFYAIFGSFPHSGPADECRQQTILVKGGGLTSSDNIKCQLGKR